MRILLVPLLLLAGAALAAETPPPPPPPAAPTDNAPVAPAGQEAAAPEGEFEPEVTIIRRGDSVIEEYRAGGRLYMVKITPTNGLPYYLIDSDGDGSLETVHNQVDMPNIVQWRILQW